MADMWVQKKIVKLLLRNVADFQSEVATTQGAEAEARGAIG